MHSHDRSHVSSQIPPTRRHRQVLGRVQSIRIDHEIPVILVDLRRLAPVLAAEKLGQRFSFESVDRTQVEPCRVRRDDERVGLCGQVGRREVVQGLRIVPERFLLGLVVLLVPISIFGLYRGSSTSGKISSSTSTFDDMNSRCSLSTPAPLLRLIRSPPKMGSRSRSFPGALAWSCSTTSAFDGIWMSMAEDFQRELGRKS
jgi:hypothetical protein